jgi:phenylacetate-CoA ligase
VKNIANSSKTNTIKEDAGVIATYWDEYYELMPRHNLEKIQLNRLKKVLIRAYHNLPYYRQKIDQAGIDINDVQSLYDLQRLPFTTKQDLRNVYPFGAIAEPLKNIVRIHSSSGTTGTATVVGYTRNDIEIWSQLLARTLCGCGVTEQDTIQVAFGYGLFTGGLGVHYGAEKLGATVVPMSSGNTLRQIQILKDFQISALCCTPSYALYLSETAKENQIDWSQTAFRLGIFGAEPWSEEMRIEIEKKLPIRAFDIYGLSEVIGPGVAFECEFHQGLHISEDCFIPEIVDIQTGKPLPPGETGELVFTTLTKEGTPVLRYRTGDISSLKYGECQCGRTMARMERVTSRTDDMLIIRGVNVYPSQIESVILSFDGIEPYYQILISRENFLDKVEVEVEVSSEIFSDEIKVLENLRNKIEEKIKAELNLSCSIKLIKPKSITRSEGKAKRVIDLRKKEGFS